MCVLISMEVWQWASGMMGQLGCGQELVWKARSEAETLLWACGTRPWRTKPAIATLAWRTAAAVPLSGTQIYTHNLPFKPVFLHTVFTPKVSMFSVISTCWIGASVLMMRRGFWSFFRAWNLKMVSPLGVNRCSTLSTPLQITPLH